ncbi:HIT domain-containing protein [Glaciecola sp. HTCC2999]|jgi:diadenosine tetraphosphate (Ap4A) HIT family hydrolase|uniref:HIT domain-containing protein n=1 Tax=Glaciecola sp. HTCC2999 TaxID=455436 RepID=UPI0000E0E161|nr:HIT domain-containing protein [Glaciecola sp. HTCC2999]
MFKLDVRLQSDTFLIAHLPLSDLLLMNDKQYPWCILVPRVNDISELHELTDSQQALFNIESNVLSRLLMDIYQPTTLNVAALGNVVRQLHIHHVARFEHDIAWPKPIWGQREPLAYNQSEAHDVILTIKHHSLLQDII